MFLNDNNFNDPGKVYHLAQHIFSVEKYYGYFFIFYGNKHIWEIEPETPKSTQGVLMAYIKSCGGKATKDECAVYLDKLKIGSGNINGILRVDNNCDVLQYRSGEYLLSEIISINDLWLGRIKECLDILIEDRPYIILPCLQSPIYRLFCMYPISV
jgi:hypothetical protein